jgi:hypothetical protein
MTLDVGFSLFGELGLLGIVMMLFVLGMLSQRMSATTKSKPVYLWFFVSAILVAMSLAARLVNLAYNLVDMNTTPTVLWLFLYDGLPTVSLLIALIAAWHYWSWLLAERD